MQIPRDGQPNLRAPQILNDAVPVRRAPPRRHRLASLGDAPERQVGLMKRSQLKELGWTRHHVDHEIAENRWTQVAPEVVALQNAPLTYEQRLWLGVLHVGSSAAISHGTACSRLGLTGWPCDGIDVITRKSHTLTRLPGFYFHETRRDYPPWIRENSLPPMLRLDQAALLAAERKRASRIGIGFLAACVQQRLTNAERLLAVSLDISKLRHGKEFRLALGDIAGGAQSFAEIDIGNLCRRAGLKPPDRQEIRRDRDGRRRYLDCTWILADGRRVVLEIDGSFHLLAENWWRDMRRERDLVISGRVVLRCSSIELRLSPDDIMRDLYAVGVPRY